MPAPSMTPVHAAVYHGLHLCDPNLLNAESMSSAGLTNETDFRPKAVVLLKSKQRGARKPMPKLQRNLIWRYRSEENLQPSEE